MKPISTRTDKTAGLFIWPSLDRQLSSIVIEGPEAAHAVKSRRLGIGDPIQITDGNGWLGQGRIVNLVHRPVSIEVSIHQASHHSAEPVELILASALPKGERQGILLDMATQLGISAFLPLECEFSTVRFQSKMIERWQRVMHSSSKQSRRLYLPTILQSGTPAQLLDQMVGDTLIVYGEQHGESIYQIAKGIMQPVDRVVVMIGPEGGFSEPERKLLKRHQRAKALIAGKNILRTETAGPALLSAVNQVNWLNLASGQ